MPLGSHMIMMAVTVEFTQEHTLIGKPQTPTRDHNSREEFFERHEETLARVEPWSAVAPDVQVTDKVGKRPRISIGNGSEVEPCTGCTFHCKREEKNRK